MKLMIVSSEFPPGPGGIGTHAYYLAKYLAIQGWDVSVLAKQDYSTKAEIDAFKKQQSFQIITLPSLFPRFLTMLYHFWLILVHVMRQKPSVIVVSGMKMIWISAFASIFFTNPLVFVVHGGKFLGSNRFTDWAIQRAKHIIAVSQYTKRRVEEAGARLGKILAIPNGADNTRFYCLDEKTIADFRASRGLDDKIILLTVGNVSERKGQQVVIQALPHILKDYPKVHYFMLGLPSKQAEYEALAKSHGVSEHIHFLGRQSHEDLLLYLNACDIFLMTSVNTSEGDFEGYGIAVIEAALCKKTAIVSDNSGLTEAVIHQETGLIVAENNPVATADAVKALLENPAMKTRLEEQAYRRAIRSETWEAKVNDYHQVLCKVVGQS
jgi:phosphatidylinositol alpha-1,6-mannosyltransferase